MTYKCLIIEFSDVLLSDLNCFVGLNCAKKQELGDAINAAISIYQQERILPEEYSDDEDKMWSSFLGFLIKISHENPNIRIEFLNFKSIFLKVYLSGKFKNDEQIADETIRKILMIE